MDQVRYCQPHLERTGEEVIATHLVNGEPFCRSCYVGATPGRKVAARRRGYRTDGALVAQLCQTATAAEVAEQLGISTFTVYRCLRLQGCPARKPGRPRKSQGDRHELCGL